MFGVLLPTLFLFRLPVIPSEWNTEDLPRISKSKREANPAASFGWNNSSSDYDYYELHKDVVLGGGESRRFFCSVLPTLDRVCWMENLLELWNFDEIRIQALSTDEILSAINTVKIRWRPAYLNISYLNA